MENQSEIKRLPDGAIHYEYYQQKARNERSDAMYVGVSLVINLLKNKLSSIRPSNFVSH